MAHHPKVAALAHEMQIPHEDAEDILRGRARKDPEAKAAVDQIDAGRDREKAAARARNADMADRLGQGGQTSVARLVTDLAADPEAFTWLCRRVQLTLAHGSAPADDEHAENA